MFNHIMIFMGIVPNTNDLYIWVQSFHTLQNCCKRGGNTIFKYIHFFIATVWKCFFSSKQYFCAYNECTSQTCHYKGCQYFWQYSVVMPLHNHRYKNQLISGIFHKHFISVILKVKKKSWSWFSSFWIVFCYFDFAILFLAILTLFLQLFFSRNF